MATPPEQQLADAETALLQVKALLDAATAKNNEAIALVQAGLNGALNTRLKGLPICDVPLTEHRRQHKFGRVAKIDTDPELRAFILARVERMTFSEIADAVASHFPQNRRIGRSAIYEWWKNNQPK